MTPDFYSAIADCAMVLITAITANFLYKTLQSQKEVQRTQTELFRIESIRFRESIKPVLKYAQAKDHDFHSDEGVKIIVIKITNLTDCGALNIAFDSKNANQIALDTLRSQQNHLVKGSLPHFAFFQVEPEQSETLSFTFTLYYQDISKNRYRQNVACEVYRVISDKEDLMTLIDPELPELIA